LETREQKRASYTKRTGICGKKRTGGLEKKEMALAGVRGGEKGSGDEEEPKKRRETDSPNATGRRKKRKRLYWKLFRINWQVKWAEGYSKGQKI